MLKAARKPIIADGGIRHNGDIAKSVRFGASMVMIGSMLAGHLESTGHVITIDGKQYKQYWGSASEVQKGAYRNVEGKQMLVPYRGSIKDTLTEMQEDLQSSISYSGGRDLEAIRKVDYMIVKDSIMNGDFKNKRKRRLEENFLSSNLFSYYFLIQLALPPLGQEYLHS